MSSGIEALILMASIGFSLCLEQEVHVSTCSCPVTDDPVCTSNGTIFPSECMVNCHNRQHKDYLTIVDDSYCLRQVNRQGKRIVVEIMDNLCLFSKDYEERNVRKLCQSSLPQYTIGGAIECVAVHSSYKPRHYFVLLTVFSAVQCALLLATNWKIIR